MTLWSKFDGWNFLCYGSRHRRDRRSDQWRHAGLNESNRASHRSADKLSRRRLDLPRRLMSGDCRGVLTHATRTHPATKSASSALTQGGCSRRVANSRGATNRTSVTGRSLIHAPTSAVRQVVHPQAASSRDRRRHAEISARRPPAVTQFAMLLRAARPAPLTADRVRIPVHRNRWTGRSPEQTL